MTEIELVDLYWTVGGSRRGPRTGANGARSTGATAVRDAARVGFRGLGLWHADVTHQLETRHAEGDASGSSTTPGLKHLEVEFLADFFVKPGEPARERVRPSAPAAVRDRGGVRRPPHQGRQHPRHPVRARPADRGVRRALRGRGQPHRRHGRLRVHAVRRQRQHARYGARAGHRGRPAQRRPGDRHLAHGASSGSRPTELRADPARVPRAGSSCPTASSRTWTTRSTRSSTTASCPARASSTSPATSRRCREIGYDGPWGVEVLSAELRKLPIDEEFERAYETTAAQFRAGVA